jgi:molecular chaperone DnaK (HSP70)
MPFFSQRLCVVLALAALTGCRSPAATIELDPRTPAVAQGDLVEDLGIETLGGVFTPFLTRGRSLPCEITETFSTAADNQEHVEIRLFRGIARFARDATLVGRFVVEGLPKLPRGIPIVAVTFGVTAGGAVRISAREKSGRRVTLRRSDGVPER